MDRRGLALRTLLALVALWVVLFVVLAVEQYLLHAPSSNHWLLPFGSLTALFGLHFIAFRREDAALFARPRQKLGLEPASHGPRTMVFFGVLFVLGGLAFARVGWLAWGW